MDILIAEDTKSARVLLQATLKKWGHEVTAVENGVEALAALGESEVSLVIADWMMPEMDGVQFCREVRNRDWNRYVYILMLTALQEKDRLAEALDAGANDYVTKPFDRVELQARLQAGERVIHLERELAQKVSALEDSLNTIKQLKELLPICMYCKKIRNDDNYWQRVEVYIHNQTGTDFSHSICPDCYETVVKKELEELRKQKEEKQA